MGQPVRFYFDEHVPHAVARALRQRGIDVMTVQEAGTRSAADEEHLERARTLARTIFTQDEDFLRLHAEGTKHAGIAFAPQRTSRRDIIRGLLLVFQVLEAEDMEGHVEFL